MSSYEADSESNMRSVNDLASYLGTGLSGVREDWLQTALQGQTVNVH
jgi:hypothetical protein